MVVSGFRRPRLWWWGSCLCSGSAGGALRQCRILPDFPRDLPPRVEILEELLVLERIHAGPEAIVRVGEQPPGACQPLERLLDELLARPHPLEDLRPQDEEAAVDP